MRRSLPLVALALVAGTDVAAAQQVRWTRVGNDRTEFLGGALAFVGDWNGDGVGDFAHGAVVANARPNAHFGAVRIHSGATLSQVKEITGIGGPLFGFALSAAGDFDGDGTPDLLVGDPSDSADDGAAFVVSGADASLLQTLRGGSLRAGYGHSVASLGDVDGDAVPDFVIGAPDDIVASPRSFGLVELRSGKTGALLFRRTAPVEQARLGALIADAGDFDGDGRDDFLVGEIEGIGPTTLGIRVFSSATGAQLMYDTIGKPTASVVSGAARLADDLDGDGVRDVVVAAAGDGPLGFTNLYVGYSPATAGRLFEALDNDDKGAASCGGVGDVDGDGFGDFAVGKTGDAIGTLLVLSGATQATLLTVTQAGIELGRALDGAEDLDGDGARDLLIGGALPASPRSCGEAQVRSLPTGAIRRRYPAKVDTEVFTGGACLFDDVDGDGIAEVLAGVSTRLDWVDGVAVLAGVDGHELQRFDAGGGDCGGTLLRLPDLDGDGQGDFAVASARAAAPSRVEVRSGADGALIRAFTDPVADIGYGRALAVATQPSGAVHLAIGSPLADVLRVDGGKVEFFDVATGALVASSSGNFAGEQLGYACCTLGDINADNVVDWAVAAPFNGFNGAQSGRVAFLNGKNGAQLRVVRGAAAGDLLGTSVAPVPDANADGVAEVLIGAPGVGAGDEGQLLLASGKNAALLTTIDGAQAGAQIGEDVGAVVAGNDDLVADFLTTWPGRARVDLWSGATSTLLQPLLALPLAPSVVAVAPPALAALDGAGPGALVVLAAPDHVVSNGTRGAVSLVKQDDLYLQISPTSADPNDVVTAFVRGGKPGNAMVLLLVDIDGTPVSITLDAATLDANGAHSAAGTIPPGLSGQVWTVLGFAIGTSGKVIDTTPATFTFN